MKRLSILLTLIASPVLAHEGHAEAAGPMGHEIAHLAMAAGAVVAVYLVLEVARKVVAWFKED